MAIWKRTRGKGRSTKVEDGSAAEKRERVAKPEPSAGPAPPPAPAPREERDPPFTLGESIHLRGDLIGRIDVEIKGRVQGQIRLEARDLLIAESGRVEAQVAARKIVVRGEVRGNMTASEKIVVEASGSVEGDICAPSITLADGSRFSGTINKGAPPAKVNGALGSGSNGPKTETRRPQSPQPANTGGAMLVERRGKDRPWSTKGRRPRRPSPAP